MNRFFGKDHNQQGNAPKATHATEALNGSLLGKPGLMEQHFEVSKQAFACLLASNNQLLVPKGKR